MKKCLAWIPAVLMMIIIFTFSAKNGTASQQSSHAISKPLLCAYEKISGKSFEGAEREETLSNIDFIVRKTAHTMEYMVLCMTYLLLYSSVGLRGGVWYLVSIITTSLYASTDEIHQLFVPGRSGQIRDVCIDTFGGILGLLVVYLIVRIIDHRKMKKSII